MRNFIETSYPKTTQNLPQTDYRETSISYQNTHDIKIVEERLFHVKIQEIIDELSQIKVFIHELGKLGFENTEVLGQIEAILIKLRSRDKGYQYTKIVHVLSKYLSGIRDFAMTTNTKGVIFYKKLFESTLVAIIQELDSLDEIY